METIIKKLFLSLNLLLSIPVTHAMESAAAVEMISIKQAANRLATGLSATQIGELTRRLKLCGDENNLIATTTARAIQQQFLQEIQNHTPATAAATQVIGIPLAHMTDISTPCITLAQEAEEETKESNTFVALENWQTNDYQESETITRGIQNHTLLGEDNSSIPSRDNSTLSISTIPTEAVPIEEREKNYAVLIEEREKKYNDRIQQLSKEEYKNGIEQLNDVFIVHNNVDEAQEQLVEGLSRTIINELFARLTTHPSDRLDMINLLLEHGANPNAVDECGCTLLHNLMSYLQYPHRLSHHLFKMDETIILLITAGLRIDLKNNNGNTALDLAADYGTDRTAINSSIHRSMTQYHRVRSLILKNLNKVQAIRQDTGTALGDTQLPDALINLICEYTNLPNRDREINFANEHWQQIKWQSRLDNFRHLISIKPSYTNLIKLVETPIPLTVTATSTAGFLIVYLITRDAASAVATGVTSALATTAMTILVYTFF